MPIKETPRLLVIDDSRTVLLKTRVMLEREGYEVRTAADGMGGIEAARSMARPHCILLDYFLPDMTAVEVVAAIRLFDTQVQIVLVTGHADEKPARQMMQRLDIQGFHDKSDGPGKLMVWVDAALKAYQRRATIEGQGRAMRHILESSTSIHRLQPLGELLSLAITEMAQLLAIITGYQGQWHGLLISLGEEGQPRVRNAIGVYSGAVFSKLPDVLRKLTKDALESPVLIRQDALFAVPLSLGERRLGAFIFEIPEDVELPAVDYLKLFAQQVVLALENIRLYEMATTDSLTSLYSRAHVQARLLEWLKLSARERSPLGLIYIDIDRLKPVNDSYGHNAGDALIASIGVAIQQSVRDTDTAGRVGGDEFLVLLPVSDVNATLVVAERILKIVLDVRLTFPDGEITPSLSIGCSSIDGRVIEAYMRRERDQTRWEDIGRAFVHLVDSAAYRAKRDGGSRIECVSSTEAIQLALKSLAEGLPEIRTGDHDTVAEVETHTAPEPKP